VLAEAAAPDAAGTFARRRFTHDGVSSNDPAWSPDGASIAFSADRPSR
jgi:Tol biopolymer transport system component